jgi:nickel transport protein
MTRILNLNCCYRIDPFRGPTPGLVGSSHLVLASRDSATGHLRNRMVLLAALALILTVTPAVWAHKVSVFARVEGNRILVEGYFGSKGRAIGCPVEVLDRDGTKIHEGMTDGNGVYSFDAADLPPANGDLKIVLQAGMGHQAVYDLAADDLPSSRKNIGTSDALTGAKGAKIAAEISAPEIGAIQFQDASALKKAVEEGLDSRIQPILRMLGEQQKLLMEQKMKGPSVTEVIGGIGWIFGMVGVWAYFISRKRTEKK